MDATPSTPVETDSRRDLVRGLLALALALAPALLAIASVAEFSTQDGPAHLYNARILNASIRPGSPFSATFDVAWQPLPNWAGHLSTMLAVAWLPPDLASRSLTAATLVGFAASIFWLRWAVAGARGLASAALLSVLLALNVTWLLGFTSFVLGASVMSATLAAWWGGRERFGPVRAVGLASLLVLGYFCHPISLGLTLVGLVSLNTLTPGKARGRRAAWTMLAASPLVPLLAFYRSLTRSAGGFHPVWEHLEGPWSLRSLGGQLGWIDPLSLAARSFRPFASTPSSANLLFSPTLWTFAGFGLLGFGTLARRDRGGDRRGWFALAGLLLLGGLLGPDTMGAKHGHYLPQRVALLGLVSLVPWLELGVSRWSSKGAVGLLGVALAIQSAFVWDYAFDCRDRVGRFAKAGPAIGSGKRVGTLLTDIKGRFRANPMLHADCLFGVGADNVVWKNYETSHYYFPVKVRAGLEHPPALTLERLALLDGPGEGTEREEGWESLLSRQSESIDVVVEWCPRGQPGLDSITARRYDPIFADGPVRVWARRDSAMTARRP